MNNFRIIAVTHKQFDINDIGKFHIGEHEWHSRLSILKKDIGIDEIMFLSTCNRVEFLLSTAHSVDKTFLRKFIFSVYPDIKEDDADKTISSAITFEGDEALKHLFQVASSLDSLVVGEREIITQVRNAYEACKKLHLTGDMLRLVIQNTIECAKKVYTNTNISRNPVSVVSLAYRKLRELNVQLDSRFLIIGSGVTNSTMTKFLEKHGFSNFVVFNRTLANAEILAAALSGIAHPLSELKNYKKGFDVIVTCTGSGEVVITKEIYTSLIGKDTSKKIIIDLAVPNDLDNAILDSHDVHHISVKSLQDIARKNLLEREKELSACMEIIEANIASFKQEYKERKVELAMSEVPKKVKQIRETAINEVFASEIEKLDTQSKETLDKIIAYLEKKYISVPMKMAKEIMMEKQPSSSL